MVLVVFGVAGVGKTTIGKLLASELGWKFYEGDDFHPPDNIEKMRRGLPLTDQDRQPWLRKLRELIGQALAACENAVVACSALKQNYRDLLRVSPDVKFVFLRGDHRRIEQQLKNRKDHFFDATLLQSQFADLEEPAPSEDVITIEVADDPRDAKDKIRASLRLLPQ